MCCMDIKILLWSCESSCSLCLVMEMAGSTDTDGKRPFTSYDEMPSHYSNWMDFVFYKILGVPDVVE